MAAMFAEIGTRKQEWVWEEAEEPHHVLPEAHTLRKILALWFLPYVLVWEKTRCMRGWADQAASDETEAPGYASWCENASGPGVTQP